MTVRASDLPPAVQRKLGIEPGGRSRSKPSRAGTGDGQPCPGRCAGPKGCGQNFASFTRWERHLTVDRCRGRWEIDLPEIEVTS